MIISVKPARSRRKTYHGIRLCMPLGLVIRSSTFSICAAQNTRQHVLAQEVTVPRPAQETVVTLWLGHDSLINFMRGPG